MNQYIVEKDGGYLKSDGKVTQSLERADICPTKKIAQELSSRYGGEVAPVYLSLLEPKFYPAPVDSVYLVKKICNVMGLTIYGPHFTVEESLTIYTDELNKETTFKYTEELCYASSGELKKARNKLGDELILCKVSKARGYV